MWQSWHTTISAVVLLLLSRQHAEAAYNLNINSTDSIKSTAKQMAADMMTFYTGNEPGQTPGLLPSPYYWWECGAMFGSLIDYWYYTGDSTYNNITTQGLLFQVGEYDDYMPANQTMTEGNDDQGFWGMAVMTAAEYNFPNPPAGQPQWLALAQAVFNTQAARWDTANCNGGLRWQIFQWNNGYDYKNSIAQACLFNLGARLALYTGNSSYADWAIKTWDWMVNSKFMDEHYYIYDGAHIEQNCTEIVPYQFSYNPGAFLLGAAAMYKYYSDRNMSNYQALWQERIDGLINGTDVFFFSEDNGTEHIMIEIACEGVDMCDLDQQSFKAYLSRWMAAATKWAPWTYSTLKPLLADSAVAAAEQCTGGDNGRMCGLKWANNSGKWDGTTGVGQQMAAMEVVLANMIKEADTPVTNNTGGTSVGNSGGGGSDIGTSGSSAAVTHLTPITKGDRAGAIICTVVVLGTLVTGVILMCTDETMTSQEQWNSFRSSMIAGAGSAAALATRKGEKGKGVQVVEKDAASANSSSPEPSEKHPSTDGIAGQGAHIEGDIVPPLTREPPRVLHRVSRSSSAIPMRRPSAAPPAARHAHHMSIRSFTAPGMSANASATDVGNRHQSASPQGLRSHHMSIRSFTAPGMAVSSNETTDPDERRRIKSDLFSP